MSGFQKRKELVIIIILISITVISRAYLIQYKTVVGVDESIHMRLAQNFIQGKGLLEFDGITHNTTRPPLYSIMAGLLYLLVGDFGIADKIIFVLFGGLLSIPVYLIAKRLFNKCAGYISILLIATSISLTHTVIFSMTHTVMIFFLYMTLLIGLIALQKESCGIFVLLGLTSGLTYLSRFDGFLYVVVMFLFIAIFKTFWGMQRRRTVLSLILFLLAFGICCFPYLSYVHAHTGKWTIGIPLENIFKRLIQARVSSIESESSLFVAANLRTFFMAAFTPGIKNLGIFFQVLFSKDVYPYYLTFLSLLGIIFGGLSSRIIRDKSFIIVSLLPILGYPVFWAVRPFPCPPLGTVTSISLLARFLTPIVPAMIILSAGGIIFIEKYFFKFWFKFRLKYSYLAKPLFITIIKNILFGTIIAFLWITLSREFDLSVNKRGWIWAMSGFRRDVEFGRELKDKTGSNAVMTIFAPHRYVDFSSEAVVRDISLLGEENIYDFVDALYSKNVEYLVLDSANDDLLLLGPLLSWETVPIPLRSHLQPFFQRRITDNRWYRVYKVVDSSEPDDLMRTILTQLRTLYQAFPVGSTLYLGGYSVPQSSAFFSALSAKIQEIYSDRTIQVRNIENFVSQNVKETVFFFLLGSEGLVDITRQFTLLAPYQSCFWDFKDNTSEGWKIAQYLQSPIMEEGIWKLKSTGPDPIIYGPRIDIPTFMVDGFEFRQKTKAKVEKGTAQLFWITSNDSKWGSNNKWINIELTQDNKFHTYSVNLSGHWRSKKERDSMLVQLRFDPAVMEADIEIDYIKLSLLTQSEMIENLVFDEWVKNVKGI